MPIQYLPVKRANGILALRDQFRPEVLIIYAEKNASIPMFHFISILSTIICSSALVQGDPLYW